MKIFLTTVFIALSLITFNSVNAFLSFEQRVALELWVRSIEGSERRSFWGIFVGMVDEVAQEETEAQIKFFGCMGIGQLGLFFELTKQLQPDSQFLNSQPAIPQPQACPVAPELLKSSMRRLLAGAVKIYTAGESAWESRPPGAEGWYREDARDALIRLRQWQAAI
jgi:hypothetical protein